MQSKELKERLAKLQEVAEQKAYKELVKDITKHEGDEDREYFSSYKNSLGFGKEALDELDVYAGFWLMRQQVLADALFVNLIERFVVGLCSTPMFDLTYCIQDDHQRPW